MSLSQNLQGLVGRRGAKLRIMFHVPFFQAEFDSHGLRLYGMSLLARKTCVSMTFLGLWAKGVEDLFQQFLGRFFFEMLVGFLPGFE